MRGRGASAPLGYRLATEPHRGGRFAAPSLGGGGGARQLGFRLATGPHCGGRFAAPNPADGAGVGVKKPAAGGGRLGIGWGGLLY